MSKSEKPSKINLPHETTHTTVLEFLIQQFPHVPENEWEQRMDDGSVYREDGSLVRPDSPYQPGLIYYHRQVGAEPSIPFSEKIIEHNEHYLIAYKPHFLPVMPAGVFVNECLQQRLIETTGNTELQAVHRLDRDTAGLVLFSTCPDTRHHYHELFSQKKIEKQYQAIAQISEQDSLAVGQKWHIKNFLARSTPKFLFKNFENADEGTKAQYAESLIECIQIKNDKALFKLEPITGRTHQLRLHMQHIGYPILNDRFYPELYPKSADNYEEPLKLLAYSLKFIDPVSRHAVAYHSPTMLKI